MKTSKLILLVSLWLLALILYFVANSFVPFIFAFAVSIGLINYLAGSIVSFIILPILMLLVAVAHGDGPGTQFLTYNVDRTFYYLYFLLVPTLIVLAVRARRKSKAQATERL